MSSMKVQDCIPTQGTITSNAFKATSLINYVHLLYNKTLITLTKHREGHNFYYLFAVLPSPSQLSRKNSCFSICNTNTTIKFC